ncbi:uncharacterized protein LOC107006344 [Solanum pennellii]|uniref:Uncharacterized protein LOC107006344 n=1 Tax=Solanum pennellii TaxID=28526 RepID=A0ABM1FQV9_SOLPN|nr:uncharacterized protein LOC107006344 [Solanum pennellii]
MYWGGLCSEFGQHYPVVAKLPCNCTNNMDEYEACIPLLNMFIDMNVHEFLVIGDSDSLIHQVQKEWAVKNPKITPIEFKHTPKTQNELADPLATIATMIKHPDTDYIDPLDIEIKEQPVHCSHVEVEPDGLPWCFDIKIYLEFGTFPDNSTFNQKKLIRRLDLNFFLSGKVIYRRTPDFALLRCIDAAETVKLIKQIHAGVCDKHMNGLTLARNILRAGYFWMTLEHDCCSSSWSFVPWGMNVIGPIEPAPSDGHRLILVAINYFTKWVKAASYMSVTKKVLADFVCNNLICWVGVPESIITDNGVNQNSYLMRDICEQFRITHQNSTAYRPKMNGVVEAANKNIKKIIRKMIDNHRGWHEMFPYAFWDTK